MITDEMLRIAAAEADRAICDSLPGPEDCDHQFSPRFERKMRRVIRRGRHPAAYQYLHRAACFLVAVTLAGALWLTVDTEARGAFFAWVRQQCENFVEYRFVGQVPGKEMTVGYAPTWLPDGYEETKVQSAYFMYSSGADATSLFVVSDQMTAEEVVVGTRKADFYRDADPQNANVLVWQSESGEVIFLISAALPKNELVRIAEAIEAST